MILRKDVCASDINEAFGSGTEHNCYGKLIAQLDSIRTAYKEEVKKAKKTKLPKPAKKLIQRVVRAINFILGKLKVRTEAELDGLMEKNKALEVICRNAKIEVARWAKGNPREHRKKTQEEELKEAGQLMRRALRKIEQTSKYAQAVLPILTQPIEQASKEIKKQLADAANLEAKTGSAIQPAPTKQKTEGCIDAA